MTSNTFITSTIVLQLLVPERDGIPLMASLFYRAEDPYAIRIAFHVDRDDEVEWTFGRDLLADGLNGRVGEGDVCLWPGTRDRGLLTIALSSPHGQALFEAPVAAVTDFLQRTYQVVPAGSEAGHMDIEADLNTLLP
jgi:hypothetical protein